MLRIAIVADEYGQVAKLSSDLAEMGLNCSVASDEESATDETSERAPDVVLVAASGCPDGLTARYLAESANRRRHPPIIALVASETLESIDPASPIADFVVEPWNAGEVALRVARTLRRTSGIGRGESIQCGDLVIDLDNCEVTVDGRLVTLTFREYELLRFLAANRGRVFTRDALLNEVWGYDYYGGDRTVDVHIRRLRSKIEDPTHTFIETVRNIGYRFTKDKPGAGNSHRPDLH